MHDSPMTESHKRALVVAYYLSRFDRKGIRALGYSTSTEAFEKIGEALGVKSATVKHMRDSFDPYCSQVRVGWYQRKVLRSRANVMQAYNDLGEDAMAMIVREIIKGDTQAVALYTAPIMNIDDDDGREALLAEDNRFANRLLTGETAENYFKEQFPQLKVFHGSTLEDTRKLGIGFDFRASFPRMYRAIEVKGLSESSGYITFTDKEWSVARLLKDDYVLALVRSVHQKPVLELIPNPVIHVSATMKTVESISICWNAKV